MADISYTPTTWADGSEGGTPIDAAKLNNIESGISDAVAAIGPNDTTADGTLKAQIDALGESVSSKASVTLPISSALFGGTVGVDGTIIIQSEDSDGIFQLYIRKRDGKMMLSARIGGQWTTIRSWF